MKVTGTSINLLAENSGRNRSPLKTVQETRLQKNLPPVRISISEESKEYYRRQVQELSAGQEGYDRMLERRTNLLEANLTPGSGNYDYTLGEEVASLRPEGVSLTTEQKANHLLRAYAALYDKIEQGHKDGTRKINVEDSDSDKGYRTLTREEEISRLNASYKKYADGLVEMAKWEPMIQAALEQRTKLMERIHAIKSGMAVPSFNERSNAPQLDDAAANRLSEKLMNAASAFRTRYALQSGLPEGMEWLSSLKVF